MQSRKSILRSCVFALTAMSSGAAFAQASSSNEIEELVVTAVIANTHDSRMLFLDSIWTFPLPDFAAP